MKSAKAKAAGPKSSIDSIIDKLQPSIHANLFGSPSPSDPNAIRRRATLIANSEEAFRVLQIKRASLMPKKLDTLRVRAALVIDYLSRNAHNDDATSSKGYLRTTIPVAVLAKALGFQKKDVKKLEMMQTVMKSYLDGSSIGKQANRNDPHRAHRRKRDAASLQPDAAASSSSMAVGPKFVISPTNLIRDLCIQLGPMIPDAEFATSYALRLFEVLLSVDGVEHRANSSKRRLSRYELRRDMERHQEYYEAACFYLAVKKSEGESSHLKKAAKKTGSKKDSKHVSIKEEGGNEAMEEEEEDGYDDRPLTEMDVIRAANLLESEFKTVIDYVRDWTDGVSISLDELRVQNGTGATNKSLFEVAGENTGNISRSLIDPIVNPFEQWKQKNLLDAKMSVTKKIKEGDGKDWLTIAADEVLRRAAVIDSL